MNEKSPVYQQYIKKYKTYNIMQFSTNDTKFSGKVQTKNFMGQPKRSHMCRSSTCLSYPFNYALLPTPHEPFLRPYFIEWSP